MKYLLLLLSILLLSGCAITDNKTSIYAGYEIPYKADYSGSQVKSISIERNDWKVDFARWGKYSRTSYINKIPKHPSWPLTQIDAHNVLAVTNTLYKYHFKEDSIFSFMSDCNIFFDLGLSYTTKVARTTSSPFSFHENLGIQCGWIRFQFKHDSNAGLKPPNTGADSFGISFLLWRQD